MDFNKVYNDLRKHGISFIASIINIHSTTIIGTCGHRFKHTIMLSFSENTFSGCIEKFHKVYDVNLEIDGKMEIQEFLIDETAYNKLYLRVFHEIKQILKQSAIETINETNNI